MPQSELQDLPNIGNHLASELRAIGMTSSAALFEAGCLRVARSLIDHGYQVCPNKLYALEGAIRGIRWHDIPAAERSSLWRKFQAEVV